MLTAAPRALSRSTPDAKLPSVHHHPVFLLVFTALSASLIAAPQSSSPDDYLIVERREDLAGRNLLVRDLGQIKVKILVENLDPRGLCRFLASATGDKVNFIAVNRGMDAEDLTPISLDIPSIALTNLMGVVQQVSDMRFVYMDGLVMLTHKDAVKPMLYMEMYDLRSATMPLRSSPGPRLTLRVPGEDDLFRPPEEESRTTTSGFTIEWLEDFLREHVTPDDWGVNGVSVADANGVLVIRHTLQGHRKVRDTLRRLGVLPGPTLLIRRPLRLPPPTRSRRRL